MQKSMMIVGSLLLLVALAVPAFAQEAATTATPVTAVEATPQPTAQIAAPTNTMPESANQSIMGPSTVDVVSQNLVRLTEAVQAAGLADTLNSGEYTIFAPNDGAFLTMLNNLELSLNDFMANQALLQGVLTYHVIPGRITSEDIRSGNLSQVETVNGATLYFGVDPITNRPTINGGEASIEQADIYASNGIVHFIDNVLLPPDVNVLLTNPSLDEAVLEAAPVDSIETISEKNFVRLTEVIKAAGLDDELMSGDYTLFAPNDGAFLTLLNELDMSYAELLANGSLLKDVLEYHLVPGTVTVEDIENGIGSLETVNGATLNFGFDPSVSRVTINGGAASVEQPDIYASNGIVHIIDNVLLPPQ
ncbi:MAG: fasciclin domain-containing protein [Anaerolineae bacterium]|nr:fasciclin domain-containing protein [Anaerolineae bacterium]